MKYLFGLYRLGATLSTALSLSLAVSSAHAQSDAPADQAAATATAIDREIARIGTAITLWPRFTPVSIPLAIYTGQRTYLFRHPAAPADFARLSYGIFVF